MGLKGDEKNIHTNSLVLFYNLKVRRGALHPTQKARRLKKYLIKHTQTRMKIVLDFGDGYGTTGVACKNLNRKFIGIKKDETYLAK